MCCSPWGHKESDMTERLDWLTESTHGGFPCGSVVKDLPAVQETQVQSLGQEDQLEKKMATHSSILAWEIPWTEKPGRLQSMGVTKSWT